MHRLNAFATQKHDWDDWADWGDWNLLGYHRDEILHRILRELLWLRPAEM